MKFIKGFLKDWVKLFVILMGSGIALGAGGFGPAVITFIFLIWLLYRKEHKEEQEAKKAAKIAAEKEKLEALVRAKEPKHKECPACLSMIPYRATRCRHCTSEV